MAYGYDNVTLQGVGADCCLYPRHEPIEQGQIQDFFQCMFVQIFDGGGWDLPQDCNNGGEAYRLVIGMEHRGCRVT